VVRLHVISDVHGSVDALARSADGADALICLGDLVLFLDYADPSQGVFGELFGGVAAQRFVDLRTEGRFDEAREFSAGLWDRLGGDRRDHLDEKVRAQYAAMFAVMPEPAYLTYGNVDVPGFWADYLRPGHHVLDGEAVDIDGLRFGFVGGGLRSAMRTPYELDDEVFAARLSALGEVDVLCSHIPPALPELTYDVVARRFERGSSALLDYIFEVEPRVALFGHVHQPLARRTRIGRTECVNVGHFRGSGRPFALQF